MWRHRFGVKYSDKKTHCTLTLNGVPFWSFDNEAVEAATMYHLHYAVGFKPNDNRRGDVGAYAPGDSVNWDYLSIERDGYIALTEPYNGPWPELIRGKYGIK
jgi:hypothetical protein